MKKLLSVITAAMIFCVLLVSCGEVSVDDEVYIPIRTGNKVNYNTAHAIKGTILEQVTLDGSVTTPYTVDLSFTQMGGKIVELNIRQDFEVKEGDVIAVLDSTELEDEIVIQKLKLDSAQATYDNLRAQGANKNDIEFAKIDLDIEQYEYDVLVEKREFLVLRAPFDGRITSVNNYRVGSSINQYAALCTISDSSKVCLTARDSRGLLTNVAFGTRVDIAQGAISSTTGRVVDTITTEAGGWGNGFGFGFGFDFGGGDMPSEVTTYVIQCDEEIEFLDIGGIEVTFTTLRRDDAIIVPADAIYEATDAGNVTSSYVNVLMNGIKVQTPVTVGIISGEKAEILNGLDGSETLILP